MSLSFIATLAQEESHNRSEIMNVSIEMRFSRGIFLTPKLLGYDVDEDGNLVINEEEAKTVRLIFFMYLYGYSSQQIADTLTKLCRRTKKNNITWSANEDKYPIMLINGKKVAEIVDAELFQKGIDLPTYLDSLEQQYHIEKRMAEDIIYM